MFRRALSAVLCAVLLTAVPFGALAGDTYRMAGFDGDESRHTWEDNAFFTRMQARTGLTFTFDQYTDYSKWQAAKQAMLGQIALGRLGGPADIARAVAFLAGPDASYITGETLHVNGGMYMP